MMFHMLHRWQCFKCYIDIGSYVAPVMFHRLHEQCFIHATYVSLVMFPMFHMLLSHVYAFHHVWLIQVVDVWSLKHLRHT
jgi:hypothetical protein